MEYDLLVLLTSQMSCHDLKGLLSGQNLESKKIQPYESEVKAVLFFGKLKGWHFILYKDTFWYCIASYEKINIKIVNFLFFSAKTQTFQCSKC